MCVRTAFMAGNFSCRWVTNRSRGKETCTLLFSNEPVIFSGSPTGQFLFRWIYNQINIARWLKRADKVERKLRKALALKRKDPRSDEKRFLAWRNRIEQGAERL